MPPTAHEMGTAIAKCIWRREGTPPDHLTLTGEATVAWQHWGLGLRLGCPPLTTPATEHQTLGPAQQDGPGANTEDSDMRPDASGIGIVARIALISSLGTAGALLPAITAAQSDLTPSGSQLNLVTHGTAVRITGTSGQTPPAGTPTALELGHSRSRIIRNHHQHSPSPSHVPFLHLKYGTFDLKGEPDGGSFLGLRTGTEFDNRLTLSFNIDAHWRSYDEQITIAQEIDRNGNVITTSMTNFATTSTLIPLGVSLGLRLPGTHTLTPFIGVGVAYELLVNHVEDFASGIEDTNVYGGPGWQVFGGLIFPVTTDTHLLGELWINDAEVSRDVDDYSEGLPVRETINVSGFGARLGVEFHFD